MSAEAHRRGVTIDASTLNAKREQSRCREPRVSAANGRERKILSSHEKQAPLWKFVVISDAAPRARGGASPAAESAECGCSRSSERSSPRSCCSWATSLGLGAYGGRLFGASVVRAIFKSDDADFGFVEATLKL